MLKIGTTRCILGLSFEQRRLRRLFQVRKRYRLKEPLKFVSHSCSYMIEDPHFIRFISYLKLFTVAMLVLVTADKYLQLFVGWEGVGLASFYW